MEDVLVGEHPLEGSYVEGEGEGRKILVEMVEIMQLYPATLSMCDWLNEGLMVNVGFLALETEEGNVSVPR